MKIRLKTADYNKHLSSKNNKQYELNRRKSHHVNTRVSYSASISDLLCCATKQV